MSDRLNVTHKAWELWLNHFSDGDEVVMEADNGQFYFGKIYTKEWGIQLVRIEGKPSKDFRWHEIVFIAQGGFPVKEIMGMSYDEAVSLCDRVPTEIMREKIIQLCEKRRQIESKETPTIAPSSPSTSSSLHEIDYSWYSRKSRGSIGGGCPFVFEDIFFEQLLNPGNNGPEYWGEDNEEVLIIVSQNGAKMLSYDLSHLFFFDGLEKQMDIELKEKPLEYGDIAGVHKL